VPFHDMTFQPISFFLQTFITYDAHRYFLFHGGSST
jgi:hypothetical protein